MNNDLNNNNSTDSRVKSTKSRVIKIILYLLILIGIFLLLVVSCNKNKVSALDNINNQEFIISDLNNFDYFTYSTPFDNNLVINSETDLFIVYFYDNSNNLRETIRISVIKWGNNSFALTLYGSGYESMYEYHVFSGTFEYNAVCFSATFYDSAYQYNFDYVGYTDDSNREIYNMGNYNSQLDNSIYKIRYEGNLIYWYKSLIPQHTFGYQGYIDNLYNYLTTNKYYQDETYREEHLFGNLVSSFLNIQFGRVVIGNTTYDLTLGVLLLFILGLGALFIVIKVFLGG